MKKGLFAVLAGFSLLLAAPAAHAQGGPTITSPSAGPLADGYTTIPYSQAYTATGGLMPNTWSVFAGALPSGLSLNAATGTLSGTPSMAQNQSFDIRVSDDGFGSDTRAYSLAIYIPPAIGTPAQGVLPAGGVSSAYSQTFTATGGRAPNTWSVSAGALPSGLSLNVSTGVLSGTPSMAQNQAFDITVSDDNLVSDTRAYSLEILSAPTSVPAAAWPMTAVMLMALLSVGAMRLRPSS